LEEGRIMGRGARGISIGRQGKEKINPPKNRYRYSYIYKWRLEQRAMFTSTICGKKMKEEGEEVGRAAGGE